MASLTLKGLPPELLDELRLAAQRERRSVNQQAILLLERALRDGRHHFLARLDAFYAAHGMPTSGGDEWDDVRAGDTGRASEE